MDLLLHHYETSPYAAKVRYALALKGLSWVSVEIPQVMPKPDLIALTGGYRMTPVLQVGANVFCDSHLITRHIDSLSEQGCLYPDRMLDEILRIEHWANSLFLPSIVVLIGIDGIIDDGFLADRNAVMPKVYTRAMARTETPAIMQQLATELERLEQMLARRTRFLIGDTLTAADLAMLVSVSTLFSIPVFAELVAPFTLTAAWLTRMDEAISYSQPAEMTGQQALSVARNVEPIAPRGLLVDAIPDIKDGSTVRVSPTELGNCPVEGRLVGAGSNFLVVSRANEQVGEVFIHFPRHGFSIEALKGGNAV